jgi:hypothetical protein
MIDRPHVSARVRGRRTLTEGQLPRRGLSLLIVSLLLLLLLLLPQWPFRRQRRGIACCVRWWLRQMRTFGANFIALSFGRRRCSSLEKGVPGRRRAATAPMATHRRPSPRAAGTQGDLGASGLEGWVWLAQCGVAPERNSVQRVNCFAGWRRRLQRRRDGRSREALFAPRCVRPCRSAALLQSHRPPARLSALKQLGFFGPSPSIAFPLVSTEPPSTHTHANPLCVGALCFFPIVSPPAKRNQVFCSHSSAGRF